MPNPDEHVVVRPARPFDAEAICAIYNAAIAERRSTFEPSLGRPQLDGEWRDVLVVERLLG